MLLLKDSPEVGGSETVMRLLERNAKVTKRFGGGFVQSIDGRAGGGGRDWFYFVNGVEASKGAAATKVHDGDRVWWDRHDWGTAMDVSAVVGAYPEPFRHGIGGQRLPVRVECAPPDVPGCDTVADLLGKEDVLAAKGGLGASYTRETLRVVVGLWPAIRDVPELKQLERGPGVSGVFAQPSADGRTIKSISGSGRVLRTLGPGTGLVAAASVEHGRPVWVVTGTDVAGLRDAAEALQAGILRDKFALLTVHGKPVGVPEAN